MVGVQGSSDSARELLDAQALVGHLVPAGSVYGFLAEHRSRVFPDEMFADLFVSTRGRPSQPADLVATVLAVNLTRLVNLGLNHNGTTWALPAA